MIRTYQIVDNRVKYIEDYTIGENGDFKTVDELKIALNELIGNAIDSYYIETI